MLLGLTGGYCAGKNAVAALLEARGWTSIDVDRFGHQALEACRSEVVAHFDHLAQARFGRGLLDADGKLERKLLGAIVFSDPALLAAHESIVHPAMFALVDDRIAELSREAATRSEKPRIVVNAAILYKMPVARSCDALVEVRAPLVERLRRAKSRDGLGWRRALDRIASQRGLWKRRPARGVSVLRNGGDRVALEQGLARLLGKLEDEARGSSDIPKREDRNRR